ncbi:MAG: hypothetical protein K2Y21_07270 [Phycisphaerales bacterium]|nr:hypothetical protein [Phycisphaerales bacterium]
MRNATTRIIGGMLIAALLAGSVTTLSGCGDSKPKPKPVAPPPPPPPPPPKQIDTGALLQTMRADQRIQFPNEKAPSDEAVAKSVIDLATAIVKGDDKAMGNLLISTGKDVLDSLTTSGAWEEATAKIEAVRVVELTAPGEKPQSFTLSLAVQEPGSAYVMRFTATLDNGTYKYTGLPGGRLTRTRANQFDDGKFD